MKFKDLLNEKWAKTVEVQHYGPIEIFSDNISSKEIREIIKPSSFESVRIGAIDDSSAKMYAWNGDILHDVMRKHIKFDVGFVYRKGSDEIETIELKEFKKFKNKNKLFKKLKKIFPKAKRISSFDNDNEEEYEI